MSLGQILSVWADRRFFSWIDKRVSAHTQHRLHRHNLYTFPTAMGFAYLLLTLLIWLLGTNYQNNLILGLAYLLLSLFVITILHTYFNLAGLAVKYEGCEPCYAGEFAQFKFSLKPQNGSGCDGVSFRWQGGPPVTANVVAQTPGNFFVKQQAAKRGYLCPHRLLVESRYPLGLIRCWSWLQVPTKAVVYPVPVECAAPGANAIDGDSDDIAVSISGDDFYGFNPYQYGDPLRSVGWKHYARGRGLMTKQMSSAASEEVWLDYNDYRSAGTEAALSHMCYWAKQYLQTNTCYGLKLPGTALPPGQGDAHFEAVLFALATYEIDLRHQSGSLRREGLL